MSNSSQLTAVHSWFENCLKCVAGRREYQLNRYMIKVIDGSGDILKAYRQFEDALHRREAVACFFVLSPEAGTSENERDGAVEQMARIAEMMAVLCDRSPEELLMGGNLNKQIELPCPVTDQNVVFDDFDAVAFCPKSEDKTDALYDPMMGAPFLSANLSSDIYAFSIFTRDMAISRHGCEVWELPDNTTRREHFAYAANMWQRFAVKTIKNFIKATDVQLCPTSLSHDRKYWYANHQDPAFAETRKDIYRHDMPVLYTQRVIDIWQRYYQDGEPVSLSEATPPGVFDEDVLDKEWL